MVQRSREKEQKQEHINGTEKNLLEVCTTTGVRNSNQKSSGRTGERPTSFPEDTSVPYLGFEPELARLQAKGHILPSGWAAKY
ncbi:hypothetical protein TNCV_2339251 [Trichonephila clavipes]|nr:hypothetical protein TNCV_2339251 [Trichonephila clavipes]